MSGASSDIYTWSGWSLLLSLFVPRLFRNVINKANPVNSRINQDYRFLFNDGGWTFSHWNVHLLRKCDLCWRSLSWFVWAPRPPENFPYFWEVRLLEGVVIYPRWLVLVLLVRLWHCDNTDITQDTQTATEVTMVQPEPQFQDLIVFSRDKETPLQYTGQDVRSHFPFILLASILKLFQQLEAINTCYLSHLHFVKGVKMCLWVSRLIVKIGVSREPITTSRS